MKLYEHEAADILSGIGIPVPDHFVVSTAEEAETAAAVRSNVPKGTEELNLKAFRRGMEMGREEKQ